MLSCMTNCDKCLNVLYNTCTLMSISSVPSLTLPSLIVTPVVMEDLMEVTTLPLEVAALLEEVVDLVVNPLGVLEEEVVGIKIVMAGGEMMMKTVVQRLSL